MRMLCMNMDSTIAPSTTTNAVQFKDEKQLRSVFVGNIPYDSSEEDLKSLFSQIGPIISLRLVYDRETGKAKGYGFCEYADIETANSAIRNLNGCEFRNRHLRVDSASCDKNKEDIKVDEPVPTIAAYTNEVSMNTSEVPEMITNIISNMPSEKIFELLKQIKMCAVDSPDETKEMLIQNPQLAYAILQALLLMNIIDSRTARAIVLDKPLEYTSQIKTFNQVIPEPTQFVEKITSPNPRNTGLNATNASQQTPNMVFPPQLVGGMPITGSPGIAIPPPFSKSVPPIVDLGINPTNLNSEFHSNNDNHQPMGDMMNEPINFNSPAPGFPDMRTMNQPNVGIKSDSQLPPLPSKTAGNIDSSSRQHYPFSYHYGAPNIMHHPTNYWQPGQPPHPPPPPAFDPRSGSHHYDDYYEHEDYPTYRSHERHKNHEIYRHMVPPPPSSKVNYSREEYSRDLRPRSDYYDRSGADIHLESKDNYHTSISSHSVTTQDPRLRRGGPPRGADMTKRSERRKPRNV